MHTDIRTWLSQIQIYLLWHRNTSSPAGDTPLNLYVLTKASYLCALYSLCRYKTIIQNHHHKIQVQNMLF